MYTTLRYCPFPCLYIIFNQSRKQTPLLRNSSVFSKFSFTSFLQLLCLVVRMQISVWPRPEIFLTETRELERTGGEIWRWSLVLDCLDKRIFLLPVSCPTGENWSSTMQHSTTCHWVSGLAELLICNWYVHVLCHQHWYFVTVFSHKSMF